LRDEIASCFLSIPRCPLDRPEKTDHITSYLLDLGDLLREGGDLLLALGQRGFGGLCALSVSSNARIGFIESAKGCFKSPPQGRELLRLRANPISGAEHLSTLKVAHKVLSLRGRRRLLVAHRFTNSSRSLIMADNFCEIVQSDPTTSPDTNAK
jgi:hypothetical protein